MRRSAWATGAMVALALVGLGSPRAVSQTSRPSVAEVYRTELLTILSETHSPDAFVVALGLLMDTKVQGRAVIPLILRNAERVGILGATASTRGPKADRAQFVIETVRALSEKRSA